MRPDGRTVHDRRLRALWSPGSLLTLEVDEDPDRRLLVRRTLTALTTLTLLLAGCATDDGDGSDPTATTAPDGDDGAPAPDGEDDAATDDDAAPDDDAADDGAADGTGDEVADLTFVECEAERFTIGYPEGWHTSDPDGFIGPCEVFHPEPIDEPDAPRDRDLHHAVSVYVDAVDFDELTENPNDVLEERELTVDGRRARLTEFRSTGDALVPEGERRYGYTVDLDGEILVAVTHSVGDTDYERDQRILDHMVTEELDIEERAG